MFKNCLIVLSVILTSVGFANDDFNGGAKLLSVSFDARQDAADSSVKMTFEGGEINTENVDSSSWCWISKKEVNKPLKSYQHLVDHLVSSYCRDVQGEEGVYKFYFYSPVLRISDHKSTNLFYKDSVCRSHGLPKSILAHVQFKDGKKDLFRIPCEWE